MKARLFYISIGILIVLLFAKADVPRYLSHQGYLTDSTGQPVTGSLPVTVRLYNDSTGGLPLLSQTFESVQVTAGVFNLRIDIASLPQEQALFLETEVDGQVLVPRECLTTVPYAVWADTASVVRSLPPVVFSDSARVSGGVPENSITTLQIRDSTIRRSDLDPAIRVPYADTAEFARITTALPSVDSVRIAGTVPDKSIGDTKLVAGSISFDKLAQNGAIAGEVLKWNGTAWVPGADSSGGTGTVTAVWSGPGLSGGPIYTSGTLRVAANGIDSTMIAAGAVTSGKILNGTIQRADVQSGFKAPYADTADYARGVPPVQPPDSVRIAGTLPDNTVTDAMLHNGVITFGKFAQNGAAAGQVIKWNGTAWAAGDDSVGAAGSGTGSTGITSIVTGQGLTGGPITTSGTISIAPLGIDSTMVAGNAVTSAKILNGTIQRVDVAASFKAPFSDTSDYARAVGPVMQADSARIAGVVPDNTIRNQNLQNSTILFSKIAQNGAVSGQVIKWNGTAWGPANDSVGTGGGASGVTSVATGAGLTGGPITTTGTVSVASLGIDSAMIAGNAVTSAKILNGTIQRIDVAAAFKAPFSDTSDYARAVGPVMQADSARIAGAVPDNTIRNQNLQNSTILFSKIAQNGAVSGQVIKWNGTAWAAANDSAANTSGLYLPLAGGAMTGAVTNTGDPSITMGKGNFGTANLNTGSWSFVAGSSNSSSGNFSVVGGGSGNTAGGTGSAINGGTTNTTSNTNAAIGGGTANTVTGSAGSVGGGYRNLAGNDYSTVAGGSTDTASGLFSTVPGGMLNAARAGFSFAAGYRAKAITTGTFVWADSTAADFVSTASNQFLIRAGGGVGINTASPSSPLSVNGVVQSMTGGFKFPDGTVQVSAAGATSDFGRSGVSTDLYEGTTPLSAKYLSMTGPDSVSVAAGTALRANVTGSSVSPSYAFYGSAQNGGGGDAYGGYFLTTSLGSGNHTGVSGSATTNATAAATGVSGTGTNSSTGNAVGGSFTAVSAGTGNHYGLMSQASGASGQPTYGLSASANNTLTGDVFGGQFTVSNAGSGHHYGVQAVSHGATSVEAYGLYGSADNTASGSAYAVYGYAANSGSGNAYGGYFYADSLGSGTKYGVFSYAPNSGNNRAGYFAGAVQVTGNLSKGGGSFRIDHPLDPEHKYLQHSFVESPDMMNIYNGNVVLDKHGEAVVTMPSWFQALNEEYRYQLTAIGAPSPNLYIARKITGNEFRISGGSPNGEVSWQVTGIRHDGYANVHRIETEVVKPPSEAGTYLHPEAFGLGQERSLSFRLAREAAAAQQQAADKAAAGGPRQ